MTTSYASSRSPGYRCCARIRIDEVKIVVNYVELRMTLFCTISFNQFYNALKVLVQWDYVCNVYYFGLWKKWTILFY